LSLTNILVYLSTFGFSACSVFDFFFFDFDFEAARPVAGAISRAAANNKTRDLERIRI